MLSSNDHLVTTTSGTLNLVSLTIHTRLLPSNRKLCVCLQRCNLCYEVMMKSLTSEFAEFNDIIMKKNCARISKVLFRKKMLNLGEKMP